MSIFWQNLITFLIVGIAIGYTGYRIYLRFSSKRKHTPCDDCDGCALKEGFREKNCPKDLFQKK